MTRDELLATLAMLAVLGDEEQAHHEADDALLAFIDDDEVSDAFYSIPKWYA